MKTSKTFTITNSRSFSWWKKTDVLSEGTAAVVSEHRYCGFFFIPLPTYPTPATIFLSGDLHLGHLKDLFGLDDVRFKGLIHHIFTHLELRFQEGEKDLKRLKLELLRDEKRGVQSVLGGNSAEDVGSSGPSGGSV